MNRAAPEMVVTGGVDFGYLGCREELAPFLLGLRSVGQLLLVHATSQVKIHGHGQRTRSVSAYEARNDLPSGIEYSQEHSSPAWRLKPTGPQPTAGLINSGRREEIPAGRVFHQQVRQHQLRWCAGSPHALMSGWGVPCAADDDAIRISSSEGSNYSGIARSKLGLGTFEQPSTLMAVRRCPNNGTC